MRQLLEKPLADAELHANLAMDVIDRVPGEDLPEVRDWQWAPTPVDPS